MVLFCHTSATVSDLQLMRTVLWFHLVVIQKDGTAFYNEFPFDSHTVFMSNITIQQQIYHQWMGDMMDNIQKLTSFFLCYLSACFEQTQFGYKIRWLCELCRVTLSGVNLFSLGCEGCSRVQPCNSIGFAPKIRLHYPLSKATKMHRFGSGVKVVVCFSDPLTTHSKRMEIGQQHFLTM